MSTDLQDFKRFLKQRKEAASAYVLGDAGPIRALSTGKSPATFFGPMGGKTEGAKRVIADYEKGAKAFQAGGKTRLEIAQINASGDLAFWTGLQRAKVRMQGKKELIGMDLRITEVFRREEGSWKLVHRHADMLAAPPKKPPG